MMLLEASNLTVHYGGICALRDVSLSFDERHIITIIGANGAGKSTLLNAVMNVVRPTSGDISFEGRRITGIETHQLVKRGITLVPEGRMLFTHLSVKDNLSLGAYPFRNSLSRKELDQRMTHVYELFPILQERRRQLAGTLSGGQQQMLAIGRALMASPRLLMLDEPSMGLAPLIVKEIFTVLKRLNNEGMSILLIEQNARSALKISDYGFVLESGRLVNQGTGSALLADEKVCTAYLGG
jgi:branched-chain amino acid transport system ATP-binding protein